MSHNQPLCTSKSDISIFFDISKTKSFINNCKAELEINTKLSKTFPI